MNRHRDPGFDFPEVGKWPIHVQISHYATISCKRLERIGHTGKKAPRKPTIEEIDQARVSEIKVLTAVSVKVTVFWEVVPSCLSQID
jgi:hypothetical protein